MIPTKWEGESYHFPPIPPIAGSKCFAFVRIASVSVGGLHINKPPTTPNAQTQKHSSEGSKTRHISLRYIKTGFRAFGAISFA